MRARRAGFTLLEVMIALAILTVSMVLLMEIQSTAIQMTREAEKLVTATNLADEKMAEVLLFVEEEGFGTDDIYEHGDFSDFGDDAFDLQFAENLEDFHWEYWVEEIDLGLAGDLAGSADTLAGSGYWGEGGEDIDAPDVPEGGGAPDLSALGVSNEMITEMLGQFIREVRMRVWWGEDSRTAEDLGDEILVTSHVINPSGQIIPGAGAGGTTGGAAAPGGANAMPGGVVK